MSENSWTDNHLLEMVIINRKFRKSKLCVNLSIGFRQKDLYIPDKILNRFSVETRPLFQTIIKLKNMLDVCMSVKHIKWLKGTKWAVFGGTRIHSKWYWKGSIVSAGIRTLDPWITRRTFNRWAIYLLINGHKISEYQVQKALLTNRSSVQLLEND